MFSTKPSEIVQKKYKSPFLFAFYYAFGYILFVWSIMLIFEHTSLLCMKHIGLLLLCVWLLAIPYYFILKKNCGPLYPLCSFIALLIISIMVFRFDMLLDNDIKRQLFPSDYGWNFIYLLPLLVAPVIGTFPIVIDTIFYIGKLIKRALVKPKRQP